MNLEELDLGEAKEEPAPATEHHGPPRPTPGSGPNFKSYFDFLLTNRPGISPLSFDSFHSIILIDYMPVPNVLFSTEIPVASPGGRPVPRFYELDMDVSEKLQIRVGKIWIPFDQGDPHFTFGGVMNTFEFNSASQSNFLPDVWADLGVGLKLKVARNRISVVDAHLYVVNGFREGGTDPASGITNLVYPDFSTPPLQEDNNHDKGVGARVAAMLYNTLSLGGSFFTCRYTDETNPSGRIIAIGVDSLLRFESQTTLRGGYVFMNVSLPNGLSVPNPAFPASESYQRAGAYMELGQKFGKYRLLVRGGIQNGDTRVEDANDRTIAGLRVEYNINPMLQLSLEYRKDLKRENGSGVALPKPNVEYTAARFVIRM